MDGKLPVSSYLTATEHAFADYRSEADTISTGWLAAFCYHQPFTRL